MQAKRKIIYIAGFFFSISIALVSYINSSYLEGFIKDRYVGLVYTAASFLTLIGLLQLPKVLARLGNRRTMIMSTLVLFLSYLLLAFGGRAFIVVPAFILFFISISFIFSSLDIFMENFSGKGSIGGARGFYLMIINLAWVVSQLISGTVINKTSFSGIYILSSFFILLVSFIIFYYLKDFEDPVYTKVSIRKTIRAFWDKKKISKIYFSNLVLQFFYAFMVIYTPIYLHEYMGFGWDKIGIMFSLMLLPFVLLDYPLGKISDKIGEKKLLIVGFSVMILSVLSIPFVEEPIFFLWAFILFMTRVGAAIVETMSEAYFFKVINEKNSNIISFFRGTSSLSYIIAPVVAFVFLLFVPSFKYIFFVLAAIILTGLFTVVSIKDVK